MNIKLFSLIPTYCFLSGCINFAGHNATPDSPYFITTKPLIIKNIEVPIGTKLTYGEQKFKKFQQDKIMPESKLTEIAFPKGANVLWGGVPITSIHKFFNSEMTGYSVTADFSKSPLTAQTRFAKLWQRCSDDLGITVKNSHDWSFNKNNIVDVESCSVLYQRYFKDNKEQQKFLDDIYSELQKVDSK